MKQRVVILLLSVSNLINAQFAGHIDPAMGFVNNVTFAKEGRDIKQLSNGNIIVSGSLWSSPSYDGYLMEFDSNGNFITGSQETGTTCFFACDTIDSNNYIAVGRSENFTNHIIFDKKTLAYSAVDIDLSSLFNRIDVFDLVTQPDGKFVICGLSSTDGLVNKFWVARFNSNLTIDNTFGSNGHVSLAFGNDAQARSIALQTDGKIVAVGHSITNKNAVIVRLNTNGTLDNSFFGSGYTITQSEINYSELYGVTVANNNTIYSVGVRKGAGNAEGQIRIISSTQNHSVYTQITDAKWYSISLQADSSKLIISGQSGPDGTGRTVPAVYRYRLNGSGYYEIDPSFSGFGNYGLYVTGISGINQDLTMSNYIQKDGKILLSGVFNGGMFLTRLENDYIPTGKNEFFSDKQDLKSYPNPSNGTFNVTNTKNIKTIKAYNLIGKEVDIIQQSENTFQIHEKGLYILHVQTRDGKIYTEQVIVN